MAEEKIEKKVAPRKTVSKKSSTKAATAKKAPAKKVAINKSTLSVTLIKSYYGRLPAHRATVNGLGLKRINHTVELQDTPEVRGMINKVSYLLKVER